MSVNFISLVWGANVPDVLNQLAYFGFFDYVLPFLLIFAVVFAILENIHVFQQNGKPKKGVIMIIAIAVGMLALQFVNVPLFFAKIFSNLGIGLSILLIALLLMGAFTPDNNPHYRWIFFGIGAIIFLVSTFDALSTWPFMGSWWWDQYLSVIIVLLVIIGAIIAVMVGGGKEGK